MWNIVGEESKGHDDLGEDAILEEFSMGYEGERKL